METRIWKLDNIETKECGTWNFETGEHGNLNIETAEYENWRKCGNWREEGTSIGNFRGRKKNSEKKISNMRYEREKVNLEGRCRESG